MGDPEKREKGEGWGRGMLYIERVKEKEGGIA